MTADSIVGITPISKKEALQPTLHYASWTTLKRILLVCQVKDNLRSSYLWPNGYNDSIIETWNLQMTKLKMFSFEICLWTGFQRLCAHHFSLAIKFSFNHIWELVTLKGSCRRNQTLTFINYHEHCLKKGKISSSFIVEQNKLFEWSQWWHWLGALIKESL